MRLRAHGSGLTPGVLVLLAFAASCSKAPVDTVRFGIPDAANSGAGVAASGNRVVVTWAATVGDQTNVFAATSTDGGRTFGAPIRVNDVDGDARMAGEQAPRVVLGRELVVGWISRLGGQSSIKLARSADGGDSFAPARDVHPLGLVGLRGWPSFTLSADAVVHTAWLDTRVAAAAPAGAAGGHQGHHGSTRQDVFHASSTPQGAWAESPVATDVCFCCKTAVTAGPGDVVYVAFRHVYPTNLRDIAVARSSDGGKTFAAPVRVSQDGWQIDACPEDGPSIVATDDDVLHIVWPTMVPDGHPKKAVFYTSSRDGGRTFSPRVRVDQAGDGAHAGHPQIAMAGSRVFVVWDETTGNGFRVQLREVGAMAAPGRILTLSSDGSSTYPAISATPTSIVAAWTRRAEGQSEIVVRRVALR